jgi:hypothetical protein
MRGLNRQGGVQIRGNVRSVLIRQANGREQPDPWVSQSSARLTPKAVE